MSLKDLMGNLHPPGYPDRFGHFQYTHHGRLFFACDPRAEEVFIDDISVQTSRLCRFNGACKQWMSVAEHQWIASYLVPEEYALEALLHDSPEGYIGDMIRPLKGLPGMGTIYLKVEDGIARAIAARFKLQYPWPKCVLQADEMVLGAEIAQNIRSPIASYLTDDSASLDSNRGTKLYYWPAELAQQFFMQRFLELAKKRGLVG
jgi:hypothetical protein